MDLRRVGCLTAVVLISRALPGFSCLCLLFSYSESGPRWAGTRNEPPTSPKQRCPMAAVRSRNVIGAHRGPRPAKPSRGPPRWVGGTNLTDAKRTNVSGRTTAERYQLSNGEKAKSPIFVEYFLQRLITQGDKRTRSFPASSLLFGFVFASRGNLKTICASDNAVLC